MLLSLAPMEGLTGHVFRRVHAEHFGALDRYYTPFLTPPHPVASWQEIELGRHGILLQKGDAGAVFLPQVAPEQGWTLEETLTHLALKAGLNPDDWREGASFEVFEAIVFREK